MYKGKEYSMGSSNELSRTSVKMTWVWNPEDLLGIVTYVV
jgi:hypothetical protein